MSERLSSWAVAVVALLFVTVPQQLPGCSLHYLEKPVTPSFTVFISDDQEPVPGIEVEIRTYEETSAREGRVVFQTWTDSKGKVAISDLPLGSYWIRIGHNTMFPSLARILVTRKSTDRISRSLSFDWTGMKLVRLARFEGVLRDNPSTEKAAALAGVLLIVRQAKTGEEVSRAITGSAGEFSLPALVPGIYAVDVELVTKTLSGTNNTLSGRLALQVSSDADVVDVPVNLWVRFTSCGIVYGAEPLEHTPVS